MTVLFLFFFFKDERDLSMFNADNRQEKQGAADTEEEMKENKGKAGWLDPEHKDVRGTSVLLKCGERREGVTGSE